MARYSFISLAVVVFMVVSCGSSQPSLELKAPTEFLDDISIESQSGALNSENMRIKESLSKDEKQREEFTQKDEVEKAQLIETKEEIETAEEELSSSILQTVTSEEVAELLSNEEVAEMVSNASSQEELIQQLKENTDLSEEEIQQLADYKELEIRISSAEDEDELKQILEENTSLSTEEIAVMVEEKKEITRQKEEVKFDILAKIYDRLKRNRDSGLSGAFCSSASSLDALIISPVFFGYDAYSVDRQSAQKLYDEINFIYDEVRKYDGLILQIEGNCDERGSNAYNKALGDRRWSAAVPYLTAQTFEEDEIIGISRGEECQTNRTTDNYEDWWKENRRIDFTWILK